jgi:hypothetical protein
MKKRRRRFETVPLAEIPATVVELGDDDKTESKQDKPGSTDPLQEKPTTHDA